MGKVAKIIEKLDTLLLMQQSIRDVIQKEIRDINVMENTESELSIANVTLADTNEVLRDLKVSLDAHLTSANNRLGVIRRERVTQNNMFNDLMGMLEKAKNANSAPTITVKPVDTSKGETLFLVTGDELCNLLEACKGATVRMKEASSHEHE